MYEQLQEILNKCIEKWWKPRWSENILMFRYIEHNDYNSKWRMIKNWTPWEVWYIVWTHDLFSKDSWLMEFVEWRATMSFWDGNLKVRYNEMSTMTAEEKVKYFIDNVVI